MTKKEEKEKQESSAFSDSAEMFSTLFRAEINKEKQRDEQPETEEKPLSDSEELLLSAFEEEIKPEEVIPGTVEGPMKEPPQAPAKPQRPSAQSTPQAKPPGGSPSPALAKGAAPSQEKKPLPQAPPKAAKPPAPSTPPVQPPGVAPSPALAKTTLPSQEKKPLSQKIPESVWKPLRVIAPVLGVLVVAGAVLFTFGIPDFLSFRGKPSPSPPPAKMKVQPPAPPPSPSSETVIKEEPARPSTLPKSEVKEEPRPQPSVPPTPEKPKSAGPEVPKEQPPVEVAAKKPEVAPPEKSSPLPTAPSLPYSIFLGSYRSLEGVQKAASSYREIGLFPYWFPIDLGEKGAWYRVFAGCFQTREAAEAFIQEKRIPDASTRQTPHAALAGTYRSQEELDPGIARLMKLGYGPYVIRQQDGSSRVYVGAYFQKDQAEALVAELARRGIESRPAER